MREHYAALPPCGVSFVILELFAFKVLMDGSAVSIPKHEPLDCPRCGTTWHLKRGLCVKCLLLCGLDGEVPEGQTLDAAFDQIDSTDAG